MFDNVQPVFDGCLTMFVQLVFDGCLSMFVQLVFDGCLSMLKQCFTMFVNVVSCVCSSRQ